MDASLLQANVAYKSLEVNHKFLNISVKNEEESMLMDREIKNFMEQREETCTKGKFASVMSDKTVIDYEKPNEPVPLTHWETRKLQEHHQALVREQRWLTTQRET